MIAMINGTMYANGLGIESPVIDMPLSLFEFKPREDACPRCTYCLVGGTAICGCCAVEMCRGSGAACDMLGVLMALIGLIVPELTGMAVGSFVGFCSDVDAGRNTDGWRDSGDAGGSRLRGRGDTGKAGVSWG